MVGRRNFKLSWPTSRWDKGQIIYFLVNASPKPLDVATSNFASSHDVEGTGLYC